jgi:hypothetical protein
VARRSRRHDEGRADIPDRPGRGQRRAASDKAHESMGDRKDADDVWKSPGDHHADAEPEQQGDDAEKHSGENTGRGPHGP